MKDWKSLFKSHILERGYDYYLDNRVNIADESETEVKAEVDGSKTYVVNIGFKNDTIDFMECDCPYAGDGNYCKHMAATLYKIFGEDDSDKDDNEDSDDKFSSVFAKINAEKKEIENLLAKVPESEKNKLLVNMLLNSPELKNDLKLQYDFQMDAKQMLALKNEIQDIIDQYSVKGFVNWSNAYSFCLSLETFLDNRVDTLIERHYLKQAFELNNQVFRIIGTIDMDDSDGGSGIVAKKCYEEWQKIFQNSNEAEKEKIKNYFYSYKKGSIVDWIEEYLFEFRENELASEKKYLKP